MGRLVGNKASAASNPTPSPSKGTAGDCSETDSSFDEIALDAELSALETKKSWSITTLSPYAPIFISVLALGSSIYSAWETRSHNKLSAVPFVQFYNRQAFFKGNEIGLFIVNSGLGPARISSIRAYLDGKRLESFERVRNLAQSSSTSVFTRPCHQARANWDHSLEDRFNFYIPANSEAKIYYTADKSEADQIEFDQVVSRLFVIAYTCSVYDECSYICTSDATAPVPNNECRSKELRIDPSSSALSVGNQ